MKRAPTPRRSAAGSVVITVATLLLLAPAVRSDGSVHVDEAAFRQMAANAQQKVESFVRAVDGGDKSAIHEAFVRVQQDPYATPRMNKESRMVREVFNKKMLRVQTRVQQRVRLQIAREHGVPVAEVELRTWGSGPTTDRVGQDWDVTAYVKGKDLHHKVSRRFVETEYYRAMGGQRHAQGMSPSKFANACSVEVTSKWSAEAYPVTLEADPQRYSQTIQFKIDHPYMEAMKLLGPDSALDIQSLRANGVYQGVKQYDRNILPAVKKYGGRVPTRIEHGMNYLKLVGKTKPNGQIYTLHEAEVQLARMGETAHSILRKAAQLPEAAVKLRPRAENGSLPAKGQVRPTLRTRVFGTLGTGLLIYGAWQGYQQARYETDVSWGGEDLGYWGYTELTGRTLGHALGITHAWRTGRQAGDEAFVEAVREYAKRVDAGETPSFIEAAFLGMKSGVKGVSVGTFRFLKGMTWDVGTLIGEAGGGALGLGVDSYRLIRAKWALYWHGKNAAARQAEMEREALAVWSAQAAREGRPVPADAAKAMEELRAWAAATDPDLVALALARLLGPDLIVAVVGKDGKAIQGVTVALDKKREAGATANGYRFRYVAPGLHGITAEAKGYAPALDMVEIPRRFAPVRASLTLLPVPSRLTVKVVDAAEQDVDGARVTLEGHAAAVTSSGACTFDTMWPGAYALRVEHPSYVPHAEKVTIDPTKTDQPVVTVRLGGGAARIEVRVVDDDGHPLEGVQVRIGGRDAEAAPGGIYVFADVAAGRHAITAYAEGYGPERETVDVAAGATRNVTMRLEGLRAPPPPPDKSVFAGLHACDRILVRVEMAARVSSTESGGKPWEREGKAGFTFGFGTEEEGTLRWTGRSFRCEVKEHVRDDDGTGSYRTTQEIFGTISADGKRIDHLEYRFRLRGQRTFYAGTVRGESAQDTQAVASRAWASQDHYVLADLPLAKDSGRGLYSSDLRGARVATHVRTASGSASSETTVMQGGLGHEEGRSSSAVLGPLPRARGVEPLLMIHISRRDD